MPRSTMRLLPLALLLTLLAGCGNKGPLVLPGAPGATVAPAGSATAPATSSPLRD